MKTEHLNAYLLNTNLFLSGSILSYNDTKGRSLPSVMEVKRNDAEWICVRMLWILTPDATIPNKSDVGWLYVYRLAAEGGSLATLR